MRDTQRGMTAIGFLIIAILVASVGFAALKLTPIYLEHMKVASVLEDVKADLDGSNPSIQYIRAAISKRLNIEMVRSIKTQDFKITKSEAGYSVRAQFDSQTPYIANIWLVVKFNKAVEIRR